MLHRANNSNDWNRNDSQVFWSEIALGEHVVQIYDQENEFLDVLHNFIAGGIRAGESSIVIATAQHLAALNQRLLTDGFDPFYLKIKDKYIPLDATDTLAKITIGGWPDEKLFNHIVAEVLAPAKRGGTPVRAFGEMVALLWQQGQAAAAIELERLWNNFMRSEKMTLLCAYPQTVFDKPGDARIMDVCCEHSRIVAHSRLKTSNDILYTPMRS
jgi:hypothetical protein